MGHLYANIFTDYREDRLLVSTPHIKGLGFSTQLPGGFGSGNFILPSSYFNPEDWKDKILGCHLVITDEAGSRAYEGTIEGADDADEGIGVQATGYYSKAGLKTAYLAYPTTPVDLLAALREGADLIDEWRSTLISTIDPTYVSDVEQEFLYEIKVQEMIEKIIKENIQSNGYQVQFAVYEHLRPHIFYALSPWYKVARRDLTLKYGSTVTLQGMYNKIQVIYEDDGAKSFTEWYEDLRSQARYGVREGSLSAGNVPAGVAQVAGELAISRYAKPDEQENLTIKGQIKNYYTGTPTEPYWLRAGHLLFVSDMPATKDSRLTWGRDRDQAGFLVMRTTYNHDDASLSLDIGEGMKTLEQYLTDIGISGGSVR
jgi:hypothetical protein